MEVAFGHEVLIAHPAGLDEGVAPVQAARRALGHGQVGLHAVGQLVGRQSLAGGFVGKYAGQIGQGAGAFLHGGAAEAAGGEVNGYRHARARG